MLKCSTVHQEEDVLIYGLWLINLMLHTTQISMFYNGHLLKERQLRTGSSSSNWVTGLNHNLVSSIVSHPHRWTFFTHSFIIVLSLSGQPQNLHIKQTIALFYISLKFCLSNSSAFLGPCRKGSSLSRDAQTPQSLPPALLGVFWGALSPAEKHSFSTVSMVYLRASFWWDMPGAPP